MHTKICALRTYRSSNCRDGPFACYSTAVRSLRTLGPSGKGSSGDTGWGGDVFIFPSPRQRDLAVSHCYHSVGIQRAEWLLSIARTQGDSFGKIIFPYAPPARSVRCLPLLALLLHFFSVDGYGATTVCVSCVSVCYLYRGRLLYACCICAVYYLLLVLLFFFIYYVQMHEP